LPLNADQLDAFWMVVQAGGYHAAADRLFISQSAVTQRIQALEAELTTRLFVRAGRGVTITEAGRILARHCRTQRDAEGALLAALQGGEQDLIGRLAVAAGTAEGRLWLLPLAAALGRDHPNLELTVTLDDKLDPVAALESCQVDAVIGETPLRRRGLRSTLLGRSTYRLVASDLIGSSWPSEPTLATLIAWRAIDFDPRDRITLDHLAACLPGADLSPLRRHFVNDTHGILDMALRGAGFAVLPDTLLASHLDCGELLAFYPQVVSKRPLYWTVPEGPQPPAVIELAGRLAKALKATQ
jgi:LysR family transcriptional regulator (chromosome initiation inhibitor)